MTLYESLVIRQQLQRIIDENNHLKEMNNKYFDGKKDKYLQLVEFCWTHYYNIMFNLFDYYDTHANDTISSYLQNLKNERNVSKLSLAAVFSLDKILKLVEEYQYLVTRSQDNIRELIAVMKEIAYGACKKAYLFPYKSMLLKQWLINQNDHYNSISNYEKAAMERYFTFTINNSIYRSMLRRWSLLLDCYFTLERAIPSYNFKSLSLRPLTTFKNKLESFLGKSRLDGTFFRYVRVV